MTGGEGSGGGAPAVRATSVTRRYGEGRTALSDVGLNVARGEVVGLMGPNGSGKSTLVRVLAGALVPHRGRVVRSPDAPAGAESERRRTAAVFDRSPFADCLSGRENAARLLTLRGHPDGPARERAASWLARFGLPERQHDRVSSYSRGMRRKTDLAAAFASGADLLLLDEPLEGLDAAARGTLADALEGHAEDGGAAVLTGHHAAFMAEACHRVVFLRGGAVAGRGRPARLVAALEAETAIQVGVAGGGAAAGRASGEWPDGVRLVGRDGDGTLRFASSEGGAALPGICARLVEAGYEVESVDVRRPGLDDAYLAATGAPLRGEA